MLPATANQILPTGITGERTPGCDHILQVLQDLWAYTRGQRARKVAAFQFSEAEVNEYLAYSLRVKPRVGIQALAVRLFPDNEVSVLATIDYAGIQKWNDWLVPDALRPALLSARHPVQVDLTFQATDGFATFKLKHVIGPGDVVIPIPAMEWIIQAIALHQPEWYDTSKEISLPFHLQRIWTGEQSLHGTM